MTGSGDLHVVFKVADAEYALRASDVLHMESYTGATKVPGTAPYVAGLVQIRGRVVPVVDVRARFGLAPAPLTLDSRVVVAQANDRTVGLLVDSAREVLRIPQEDFKTPPEVVSRETQGFVKAVAQSQKRLVLLLDFGKVIGEEPALPASPVAKAGKPEHAIGEVTANGQ
jgi:purine-binding chemotaxis protein CheW